MSEQAITLVIEQPQTIEIVVQPAPVIEIALTNGQGPAGPRGITGDKGDPGVSALTGGAGILVIGTEIRLSIGTLPQL